MVMQAKITDERVLQAEEIERLMLEQESDRLLALQEELDYTIIGLEERAEQLEKEISLGRF